jgi:5-oxoprolinase (ATP-hydrolysing)
MDPELVFLNVPGLVMKANKLESCRIGTTVATNALLEKKGERFALLTTRGN